MGVSEVGAIDFGEATVEIPGVEEKVAFEIVFEGAEVEVGGTDGDEFVVDDNEFGMEHTGVVEIDFDTGSETFGDVRGRCEVEEGGVGFGRDKDADVDLSERGRDKDLKEGIGWEEVGSLDINALAGAADCLVEHVGDA